MPALANPRHERFAQSRAQGMAAFAAYTAAGYPSKHKNSSRLSRRPDVIARIAELRHAAEHPVYDREYIVRTLVAILESPPSAAEGSNPLCESRVVAGQVRHMFPPKLEVIDALSKVLDSASAGKGAAQRQQQQRQQQQQEQQPDEGILKLLDFVRRRK